MVEFCNYFGSVLYSSDELEKLEIDVHEKSSTVIIPQRRISKPLIDD